MPVWLGHIRIDALWHIQPGVHSARHASRVDVAGVRHHAPQGWNGFLRRR